MSLSEPDSAFLTDRNLTFLFALRPDGRGHGSGGPPCGIERTRDTAELLTFDLTARTVTSASFAKLLEPTA
jgi:hypothetical protein